MALGTALASRATLWALGATALVGAATPRHPFDWLYLGVVRPLVREPWRPPNGAPRRFACGLAAARLGATGWAFHAGAAAAGYALGGVLAAVALLVSATDICIPSLLYGAWFGRPTSRADTGGEGPT